MPLQSTYLSCNKKLFPHYYLCNYLPLSAGKDTLSHSLLKFKRGQQPDLEGWIDCALEIFAQASFPPGATLVRAFHHDETTLSDTPLALDLLGQRLAAASHHYYHPHLLLKAHPIRPVKNFSKPRREEELQGLYAIDLPYAASLPEGPPKHWLIIDDILTSGATARSIIHAIHQAYPPANTPISIFTLARADTINRPHSPTALYGRNYQLQQGMDWVLAEAPIPYYSLIQLKNNIRNDNF